MTDWLPRLVARVPATVHTKLVAAFLVIVLLLITVGAVGLRVLSEVNRRAEELVMLHRKIAAYRQLQHDTTGQLYSAASDLLVPNEQTLEATLRQLNQFGYDLDRLQFVAKDEVELFGRVRKEYDQFIQVVTRVIELIREGKVAEGRELQLAQAGPLADRLERLTNELVNKAEADMVARIEVSHNAYVTARWVVIVFSVGSIGLALILGYAISWSLIGPVKRMDVQLQQIAQGDFSHRVEIPNQDELGALAANLNRMSEELGRLYHQLEAANRHKSEFLASMSHELRTPLNAIIGFSEVLLEKMFGELNERQEDYLQDILSSGRHLLALINDVLDLSKVEAGKMELEPGVFNLRELLEGSLVMVKERALAHGIVLALDIADNIDTFIGDERKVKQILFNLLSNAVKFTPDKGKVGITAKKTDGAVQVAVWDTGIGIATEDQQRIFEEFQQVGKGLTEKPEGTGLGLALTKKFVDLHGGAIWLDSTPGRGSTFTFTLPIAGAADHTPPPAVQQQTVTEGEAESASASPLVLVIEDDAKAAELLRLYLTEAGYSVALAQDGTEGLEQVKRLQPGAVILDVLLPKVDGWAFLTHMKADPATKDVPVIITSIVDQKGKGFALGAAQYLVKPVRKEELLRELGALRVWERSGKSRRAS
jgi:signal transduction histidine kinase/ActR/RegA family two-component response regulator